MNKRRLHHLWTKFRAIKPIYFLILTIIFGVVAVFALRANNQHMVILRDAVYAADKEGKDVAPSLTALQKYVTSHMNTDLSGGPNAVYPPIQLKYTYERLVSAEGARVAATNSKLTTDAAEYCEQKFPGSFSGGPRVPCVTEYINSHATKPQPIPDALYKFSFISPNWSPDLAGWSLFLTFIFGILTLVTFLIDRWFRRNVA